jgi:hypothetical protein
VPVTFRKYEGKVKNSKLFYDQIFFFQFRDHRQTYDIPKGAGSRATAFDGADDGTVYVTVADQTKTGRDSNTTSFPRENIMALNLKKQKFRVLNLENI